MAVPFPYGFSLISAQRLVVGADAHDAQHRAEDLVPVGVHLRRDLVEQRDAEEEAVAVGRRLAPVRDDLRALRRTRVEI